MKKNVLLILFAGALLIIGSILLLNSTLASSQNRDFPDVPYKDPTAVAHEFSQVPDPTTEPSKREVIPPETPDNTIQYGDYRQEATEGIIYNAVSQSDKRYGISNSWVSSESDSSYIEVLAGAERNIPEINWGDPNQGVLIIEVRERKEFTADLISRTVFNTPDKLGRIRIVDVSDGLVTLENKDGVQLSFNLETKEFSQK